MSSMSPIGMHSSLAASPISTSTEKYQVTNIKYRSVQEKRLADELLKKEGQWDAQRQVYFTRERQLQERTHLFQRMHQQLRFNPESAYDEQGVNMEAEYPQCPRILLHEAGIKRPDDLSDVDPHPDNVEAKRIAAEQTRSQSKLQHGFGSLGASSGPGSTLKDEASQQIEAELLEVARSVARPETPASLSRAASTVTRNTLSNQPVSRVRSSLLLNVAAGRDYTPTPNTPDLHSGLELPRATSTPSLSGRKTPSSLPEVHFGSDEFSSMMVQLRKTRKMVEAHNGNTSTVRSVLEMEGSADLKRTITQMFANPKMADEISQEAHDRREKAFEDERRRTMSHQLELLKEEREAMERELAHFS